MTEPRWPPNLAVIQTPDRLDEWLSRLRGRGTLAIDTETTGLQFDRDRVGGLCLAANETALYITKDALALTAEWLAREVASGRELVFHNAKFDLHMLRGTFGIAVPYPVHDTMVQSFLIDNRGASGAGGRTRGGHGLKDLASVFVDPFAKEAETDLYESVVAAGGNKGSKKWKGDLLLGDVNLIGKYGVFDAWYTLQLHRQLLPRIAHWEQPSDYYPSLMSLYENERWLLSALVEMEQTGIRVQPEFFERWERKLNKRIDSLHAQLHKLSGGADINWGSPKQLRELLFDRMGLAPTRWTNSNEPSTDEVALVNLNHPIGPVLLKLRDAEKQRGTYARGLLSATRSNGRIHCSFRQTGAETGRLSCANPNLQQVPRESGARRGFIPDEGLEFRFADYSQVEMRFAAHISNDPTLVRGFLTDPDFDTHAATAKKMWGLINEPTKQQRKFAKIMNFAMLYGAGADKIASQLVSLLSTKEAKHAIRSLGARPRADEAPHKSLAVLLMQRYFTEFPAIKDARYKASDRTKNIGYAMNEFGRHRYIEPNKAYKAFNSEIQGSAADLAKFGLVQVYRELQHNGGHIACLLQIHDEIVYLSDGDPKIDRQVLEILNDNKSYRVPIVADIEGSKTTWQDKVELDITS